MRASFVWEAGLFSLLIIVVAGALTAWQVTRQRARKPEPTIVHPGSDPVVRQAMEAVQLYGKFAQQQAGGIFIDQSTIEKTLVATSDERTQWNVTGAAVGESIDAANFRWIVRIVEAKGQLTLEQVRLNGDVVYSHEENAVEDDTAANSTATRAP